MLSALLMDQKAFRPKFMEWGGAGGSSASPGSPQKLCFWIFNKKYPWATSLLEVVAPSPSKSVLWGFQSVCQMFQKSGSVMNLAQVGNVEDEASSWKDAFGK